MAGHGRSVATLLPIMAVIFIVYLVIGIAMPVLPLHVHQGLGHSVFVVGLVAGGQFAAALISRPWAGGYAGRRGAKHAVIIGLLIATSAGLFYLLSLRFVSEPDTPVNVLLPGRALLGVAESFIITGALNWGLALMGPQNTGKVMARAGTARYAAYAAGAPAGTVLYSGHGFAGDLVRNHTDPARYPAAGRVLPLHSAGDPRPRCDHQRGRCRPDAGARPRA